MSQTDFAAGVSAAASIRAPIMLDELADDRTRFDPLLIQRLKTGDDVEQLFVDAALTQTARCVAQVREQFVYVSIGASSHSLG